MRQTVGLKFDVVFSYIQLHRRWRCVRRWLRAQYTHNSAAPPPFFADAAYSFLFKREKKTRGASASESSRYGDGRRWCARIFMPKATLPPYSWWYRCRKEKGGDLRAPGGRKENLNRSNSSRGGGIISFFSIYGVYYIFFFFFSFRDTYLFVLLNHFSFVPPFFSFDFGSLLERGNI